MRYTLLVLLLLSLLACKKQDISSLDKPDTNNSIMSKIEGLQSLKDYVDLSQHDKTEFLRYLSTCSGEAKSHIKAKIESLYHPKSNARQTALNDELSDDAVPADSDAWDYAESELAGGSIWRYYWTVAMPSDGSYMIRSIEKMNVVPTSYPPYYTFHLILHDHSSIIEGYDKYWYKESSFSNSYWGFTASFHCSGVVGDWETGFQRNVLNFRFVDFGVFLQTNGSQYY